MNRKDWESAILNHPWYLQGFNAVPLYINAVAVSSGLDLWNALGVGYTQFLIVFQNRYGQYCYDSSDFELIWKELWPRIQKQSNYLLELEKDYYATFEQATAHIMPQFDVLSELSDDEIVALTKQAAAYMSSAGGTAHTVEALSYGLEKELHSLLKKEVKNTNEYQHYIQLFTTPSELSFVGREEQALRTIAALSGVAREDAIQEHIQEWKWVSHSYSGKGRMDAELIEERLQSLPAHHTTDIAVITDDHWNEWSAELRTVAEHIQQVMLWQDERKANILRSIDIAATVIEELSKRSGVSTDALEHMSVGDVAQFQSIQDVAQIKKELEQRVNGVAFYVDREGEHVASGDVFTNIRPTWEERESPSQQQDLRGAVANTGTAIGPVRVCMSIDAISQVQKGDILVTSMTRPEFMPALKKAAAIVTDEGGITSHASIVSRELGIPAVIGTKVATKVLKDGMMVEVRANHGFVRILTDIRE